MKVTFNDAYLEKLYRNQPVKGKPVFSEEVIKQFKKTILKIVDADSTQELRQQKGLHFEALKGNKKGLYSIRVNKQYRLEFTIENDVITLLEIILIEHLSKHYET
ncbi:MAG: type II toxin-antitoxin system RelE/ParE family toxin [Flavobacterium sp.]|nr:type II toxin-antitoxin system RelE/ParE family toxin [Flavobacterium sp.]